MQPIAGPVWLSPSTLWIVDGVGRHLGNVMVATVHGMRWNLGPNRVRSNYRNQPVVTDRDGEDHNPLEGVTVVASRNLEGLSNNGPDSPRDYYEMRAAYWRSVEPGATTTADSAASTASAASAASSGCECGEHVAEVAGLTVPFAHPDEARESTDAPVTVAELVEWDALAVEEDEDEPAGWLLWFGDETRLHYDDDAILGLEDVLASAPGVSTVSARTERPSSFGPRAGVLTRCWPSRPAPSSTTESESEFATPVRSRDSRHA